MSKVRVQSPASIKRRGWIALFAGVFLVVLVIGLDIFMAWLAGSHAMDISKPVADAFFGRLFVGLTLILVCGVIGIIHGTLIVRTGIVRMPLFLLTILVFLAAIVVLYQASNVLPST